MIWDNDKRQFAGELSFRSEVRNVRSRRDRIVVVLDRKIFVYDYADLKFLRQIETYSNPRGICEISSSSSPMVLACPGIRKGQIRVDYGANRPRFFMAHDSGIACLAMTPDG